MPWAIATGRWRGARGTSGRKLGPQLVANGVLFGGLALAGIWWAYPLLWLLPLLTWMMVITRVRNIAEHAVVGDADDPLRNTRTTRTNWLERAVVAPYWVNYHLEHHLFFYVPCYNLPKLHRILVASPHAGAHGGCARLCSGAAQGDGAATITRIGRASASTACAGRPTRTPLPLAFERSYVRRHFCPAAAGDRRLLEAKRWSTGARIRPAARF